MENADLNKYLETLVRQIKKEIKTNKNNSEKVKDLLIMELFGKHTNIDLPKVR